MNNNLIFDIGFHTGEDTNYYLFKGYKVIGVDANPSLIAAGKNKFASEIKAGDLNLLHCVITEKDGEGDIPFYISPNTQWSSVHKNIAERKGLNASRQLIKSASLNELIREFGTPLYCKIDIEGNDLPALKSLEHTRTLPTYISVETECLGDDGEGKEHMFDTLDQLHTLGYTRFKLVDQNTLTVLNEKPFYTTGSAASQYWEMNRTYAGHLLQVPESNIRFNQLFPGSSGPFGEDLLGKWYNYESARKLMAFHCTTHRKMSVEQGVAVWSFWCDWHAAL